MSSTSRRLKLLISYDGTSYSGWQKQSHDITIQGEIEKYLSRMTSGDVLLHGAGRTDSGVHAQGMVAHFDTTSTISCEDFVRGLNSMMSGAIRIRYVTEVPKDFHARFSASQKSYSYIVYTGEVQPPEIRLYSLHVRRQLNLAMMEKCLALLIGKHDYSSFENSGSRDKNYVFGRGAVRTIFNAELKNNNQSQTLTFTFTGDGFLRNMVRNLVGTLLEVGGGKTTLDEFAAILNKKNRAAAGPTAPAHGLFLNEVTYPHP